MQSTPQAASGGLPTGTLTFMFTDIEGSTRLIQQLGEAWNGVLDDHHRLLRTTFSEYGGTEVTSEGDSFFVVFPTVAAALRAAAASHRALAQHAWPANAQVRVRVGLHTGTATLAGGSYTGLDVHRAARIMAAGHGGQVLLSGTSRALAGDLEAGLGLRDLGQRRLKDLGAPEHVYQLLIDGLPTDFPPLRALDAVANNLPVQLTSFLGREKELSEVGRLLERNRLVTLTGPGGTGKTRLALQVAATQLERFQDGVWFVALAEIADPQLVGATVAQALELPEHADRSPVQQLIAHLRGKRVLLLLDNFEQVSAAAAPVSELLAGAADLTVLVTSRSLLDVYGEQEYAVPPLGLPNLAQLPDAAKLPQYEAVALFIERARAADPDFEVTNDSAPAVAEICVRLDGLPLAIELAAARIKLLTPEAILERLGDRLGLLNRGPRNLPERQRTLRGAIEWSYELLDEADRQLFASLSVFTGGVSLEGIQRVCASAVGSDALDAVGSLVDKSLLRQGTGSDGQPRFAMLETIREFALGRSRAGGGHDQLEARHAEWCASLVDELAPQIMGPDQRAVLDRLEEEYPNVRSSFGWALSQPRSDLALLFTARLWRFWQMRGYLREGQQRAREALRLPSPPDEAALRADALEAAGGLAYWSGNQDETRHWYGEALAARRQLGDRDAIAEALYNLAFGYGFVEPDMPIEELAEARRLADEAVALFRQLGNAAGEARALWLMTTLDMFEGRLAEMDEKAVAIERVFRDQRDQFYLGWTLWTQAVARLGLGRLEDARPPIREALDIFERVGDVSGLAGLVDLAAFLALRTGDRQRAARLSGALATAEENSGIDINRMPRVQLGFQPEQLRDAADTQSAWQDGARMDLRELVPYALEGLA